jgi:hypothetical protein
VNTQAARMRWARARAMAIIPRVAARRSFTDLLRGATEEQLHAVIAVLADREALARAAHAERARRSAERLPESLADLARDYGPGAGSAAALSAPWGCGCAGADPPQRAGAGRSDEERPRRMSNSVQGISASGRQ